jgi:hypothetical protein
MTLIASKLAWRWLPVLTATVLAACGNGNGNETTTGPKGNVVLRDDNNYTSTASLTIQSMQTASGADLMVCWDAIKKDLLCHDVVQPSNGIDTVSFLAIPRLSHDDVAKRLAAGTLNDNLVAVYRDYKVPDATSNCTKLSSMTLGSSALDPAKDYVQDTSARYSATTVTYMLLFESGTTPGVGARSMMFLEPSAALTAAEVAAPDACSEHALSFQAMLGQPISIPATDATKWDVDWSQVTRDGFGNPVIFTHLDGAIVGFYQGKTAADLQAAFTDLETSATSLYEVAVPAGAKNVSLAGAKLRGGTDAFPGFTRTDGVWAVAVTCSNCQTPAPVVMSILQPQ